MSVCWCVCACVRASLCAYMRASSASMIGLAEYLLHADATLPYFAQIQTYLKTFRMSSSRILEISWQHRFFWHATSLTAISKILGNTAHFCKIAILIYSSAWFQYPLRSNEHNTTNQTGEATKAKDSEFRSSWSVLDLDGYVIILTGATVSSHARTHNPQI